METQHAREWLNEFRDLMERRARGTLPPSEEVRLSQLALRLSRYLEASRSAGRRPARNVAGPNTESTSQVGSGDTDTLGGSGGATTPPDDVELPDAEVQGHPEPTIRLNAELASTVIPLASQPTAPQIVPGRVPTDADEQPIRPSEQGTETESRIQLELRTPAARQPEIAEFSPVTGSILSGQEKAEPGADSADGESTIGDKQLSWDPADNALDVGCATMLGGWLFSTNPLGTSSEDGLLHIDFLKNVFLRLLGSEIEGREISLGILIGPSRAQGGQLTSAEPIELSADEIVRFSSPQLGARVYRDKIVGLADGTLGESVAFIHHANGHLVGLYRIAPQLPAVSAHDQYIYITSDPRYKAMWLKPASAARIYSGGGLVAQIIKLRDGLGWSIRVLRSPNRRSRGVRHIGLTGIDSLDPVLALVQSGHLIEAMRRMVRQKLAVWLEEALAGCILDILCELSEQRMGGALYIVKDRRTFLGMIEGGRILGEKKPLPEEHVQRFGNVAVSGSRLESPDVTLLRRRRESVLKLLAQDGAVVITVDGQIVASRAYFIGPGGRRAIARHVCRDPSNPIVGVVVSQDGPIYFAGAGQGMIEVDERRFR